ncbi:tetratricopeptide repeat protein [Endozoicomonas acroporae]|uniref:tetratricopeptide repeat protein n=1 Tax=Endozoicomonas acroporae TaxID=1701104 RepID=UPI0013D0E93F|nr:hypothetical protein [Endozoicomonas acroporae]
MTGYQPIRSLNGLGVLADLSKDYQRAERFYREALPFTPNDPTLLNNLGKVQQVNESLSNPAD